jgi:predicted ester cyclase
MSFEVNFKVITEKFIVMWNEHNPAIADEIFSANFKRHDPSTTGELPAGAEGFKFLMNYYLAAFPDLVFMAEDIFGAGDKVVLRWTVYGSHMGELMGFAPKATQIEVTGIDIIRFEDGKIAEIWSNWDTLGLMQQIK